MLDAQAYWIWQLKSCLCACAVCRILLMPGFCCLFVHICRALGALIWFLAKCVFSPEPLSEPQIFVQYFKSLFLVLKGVLSRSLSSQQRYLRVGLCAVITHSTRTGTTAKFNPGGCRWKHVFATWDILDSYWSQSSSVSQNKGVARWRLDFAESFEVLSSRLQPVEKNPKGRNHIHGWINVLKID